MTTRSQRHRAGAALVRLLCVVLALVPASPLLAGPGCVTGSNQAPTIDTAAATPDTGHAAHHAQMAHHDTAPTESMPTVSEESCQCDCDCEPGCLPAGSAATSGRTVGSFTANAPEAASTPSTSNAHRALLYRPPA